MKYTYETNSPCYYSGRSNNEVVITADSKAEADYKLKRVNDFGRNPNWSLKDVSEK